MQRYREVVIFVAGLMKDSRSLVQLVYEMQVEDYLHEMRTDDLPPSIDADLFKWLHAESVVRLFDHPLHNKYINYYSDGRDSNTIVYFPSTIYHFEYMKEDVVLSEYKAQRAELPECAMYIRGPNEEVTKNLLSKCRKISKHQAVTDFRMQGVFCRDATEAEAPFLSRNIRSLCIKYCQLPSSFMRNILQQLQDCVTLMFLNLYHVDLREVAEDCDKLLDNLVSNHEKGLSQEKLWIWIQLRKSFEEFAAKWKERCEGITSIECIITKY